LYKTQASKYVKTVEEFHRLSFNIPQPPPNNLHPVKLNLEILDTAGSYEFPAMRNLGILNSDAFIVVQREGQELTGEEVRRDEQHFFK
jgi:hypothetical protein